MSEKLLVTQALDERDLLVKKIAVKIAKASFVDTIRNYEENVFKARVDRETVLALLKETVSAPAVCMTRSEILLTAG